MQNSNFYGLQVKLMTDNFVQTDSGWFVFLILPGYISWQTKLRIIYPAIRKSFSEMILFSSCARFAADSALKKYGIYSDDDLKNEEKIPMLILALDNSNVYVRLKAVLALRNFGEKSIPAIPNLISRMSDTNGVVKSNVIINLERLYYLTNDKTKDSIVNALLLASDFDKDPGVVNSAQYALKRIYLNKLSQNSFNAESEPKGKGSGFLISESGLIVTNFHVISGSNKIKVSFPLKDISFSSSIVLQDKNNDIAILKLSEFNFNSIFKMQIPFSIIENPIYDLGTSVFSLGYPLSEILSKEVKFSTGTITSKTGGENNPTIFQISVPVQPGNSGGPLFNYSGELIGIVVSSLNAEYFLVRSGFVPQNVNFAIKTNYLTNLIRMLPEADQIIRNKTDLLKLNLQEKLKKIEPFIVKLEKY